MEDRIKTLIVDDESKSRNTLKLILSNYCPNVEILGLASSATQGISMINGQQFDLVFLDVEMPFGSGFDLLKKITNINFEVIFVTGFDHYALQAIKFNALDYILKPVNIDELILAISKVEQQIKRSSDNERLKKLLHNLEHNKSQQIALPSRDGIEFLPIEDILYCEAEGSCTWFHLSDGRKKLFTKNLGEYEKLLPVPNEHSDDQFFRIHYKYLVNLKYVKLYNVSAKCIVLRSGAQIEVAQRRSKSFKELLRKNVNM